MHLDHVILKQFCSLFKGKIDESKINRSTIKDSDIKLNNLYNLINDIEGLGKEMSDIKSKLNNIAINESNSVLSSNLKQLYKALENRYGKYITLKYILFSIWMEDDLFFKEDNLVFCVDFYLNQINSLKNSSVFFNDDFSLYVGDFYLVGYELMMKEFLFNGSSKIYDYFLNSNHDKLIVSDIISSQIEFLKSSKNVCSLNELNRVIDEKSEVFDKDVILQLIICMYPKSINKMLFRKVSEFKLNLTSIYTSFKGILGEYKSNNINFIKYISKSVKLFNNYKCVLKKYNDFISSYKYLYDFNVNKLKEDINVMTFEMKKWL